MRAFRGFQSVDLLPFFFFFTSRRKSENGFLSPDYRRFIRIRSDAANDIAFFAVIFSSAHGRKNGSAQLESHA